MKLIILQAVFQASNLIGVIVAPVSLESYSSDCFMYSEHNRETLCANSKTGSTSKVS